MDWPEDPRSLSDADWRARLSPEAYRVLRQHGTERAFTGLLWDNKASGTYRCGGCGVALFSGAAKYESCTGWPSFTSTLGPDVVGLRLDTSLGMSRTEVHCARCGGHLGHVFPDGPAPSFQRYCMNSAALVFEPDAA